MTEALLAVVNLSKRYGGLAANEDVSFSVAAGTVHAVIGPNGAGKTTLIDQIAGNTSPTSGSIAFDGKDVTGLGTAKRARLGLGRSFQITNILHSFSVRENIEFALQARAGHGFNMFDRTSSDRALALSAAKLMEEVGLVADERQPAGTLSHGEQRQLEMAMAIAAQPRLMLLDEPTAGMGRAESMAFVDLAQRIRAGRTVILVEHDMDVVFAMADRITVLANGKVIATDEPAAIRASAAVRAAYLGDQE